MTINEAKAALNTKSNKISNKLSELKNPGIGWEIGAYAVRGTSVIVPSVVIMALENSWFTTGLGLLATFVIMALLLIFKEPIKKASGYAPGIVTFAIFVVIAIFFDTVSDALLIIGLSGIAGSTAAIPLHLKYLSKNQQSKSPELMAIETLAERLK